MDKSQLNEAVAKLYIKSEHWSNEYDSLLFRCNEAEKKLAEMTEDAEMWMGKCKALEAENTELQALASRLNEFIAKGKAEVVE